MRALTSTAQQANNKATWQCGYVDHPFTAELIIKWTERNLFCIDCVRRYAKEQLLGQLVIFKAKQHTVKYSHGIHILDENSLLLHFFATRRTRTWYLSSRQGDTFSIQRPCKDNHGSPWWVLLGHSSNYELVDCMCAAPLRRGTTRGMDNTHRHPGFTNLPTKKALSVVTMFQRIRLVTRSDHLLIHKEQQASTFPSNYRITSIPWIRHTRCSNGAWRWRREIWTSPPFKIRFGHTQGNSMRYWGIVSWTYTMGMCWRIWGRVLK